MNRITIMIVSVAVVILIVLLLSFANNSSDVNETTLTVYADSNPITVERMVSELESHPYYSNCNNTTIQWLKSQRGVVFSSEDAYVVMSTYDAGKLPIEFVTDICVNDTFTCNIKEKRPLGKDLDDMLLVDNVKFESQNIFPGWA